MSKITNRYVMLFLYVQSFSLFCALRSKIIPEVLLKEVILNVNIVEERNGNREAGVVVVMAL